MKKRKTSSSRKWGDEFLMKLLLLCCFFGMSALASAQQKVSGTVVDSNGEPVIGASVVVKGTSTGAVTDIDGKFTFVAEPGKTIEVSYIGYKPVTFLASEKPAKIKLAEDS
mgnify:FL=1